MAINRQNPWRLAASGRGILALKRADGICRLVDTARLSPLQPGNGPGLRPVYTLRGKLGVESSPLPSLWAAPTNHRLPTNGQGRGLHTMRPNTAALCGHDHTPALRGCRTTLGTRRQIGTGSRRGEAAERPAWAWCRNGAGGYSGWAGASTAYQRPIASARPQPSRSTGHSAGAALSFAGASSRHQAHQRPQTTTRTITRRTRPKCTGRIPGNAAIRGASRHRGRRYDNGSNRLGTGLGTALGRRNPCRSVGGGAGSVGLARLSHQLPTADDGASSPGCARGCLSQAETVGTLATKVGQIGGLALLLLCLLTTPIRAIAATSNGIDSARPPARALRVAVAANFRTPLAELAEKFTDRYGIRVSATFGSSGLLSAQIRQGAPYDAFFSADTLRPQALIGDGLATAPVRVYARGRVALRMSTPIDPERLGAAHRIGLPNPRLAPYGTAAMQCLQRLGVSQQLQNRLVFGNNVNQVDHFLETGALQFGFVALSQLVTRDIPPEHYWVCPSNFHTPINQGAVVLLRSPAFAEAQKLLSFMTSAATQARLTQLGYQ